MTGTCYEAQVRSCNLTRSNGRTDVRSRRDRASRHRARSPRADCRVKHEGAFPLGFPLGTVSNRGAGRSAWQHTNRKIHHEYPHDQSPLQHTSVLDRGQDLSASKTPRAETEVRPAPDSATARFPPPWPDVPGTRGHLRRHSSTVRISSGLW